MRKFGIDISVWQGNFDMARAKREGIEFVIIKGGGGDDGLYVDSRFQQNYDKAKQLGLPVGCYWFSKALTLKQAEQEAEYFYQNVLKGRQFELPIYMDVENKTQLAVGQRMLTDIVKTWLNYLEKKGYFVGIYSSLYYINRKLYDNELQSYTHWMAQWNTTLDYAHKEICGMWQFGGETNYIRSNKVAGVVCDQNYMLQDFPTIIKKSGLNGFSQTSQPTPTPTPIPTPKEETCMVSLPILHRGSTGGYVRTLQILLNAYFKAGLETDGNFGPLTEQAVKAYQKNRGLEADGWVGPKTWKQLLC